MLKEKEIELKNIEEVKRTVRETLTGVSQDSGVKGRTPNGQRCGGEPIRRQG